MLCKGYIYAKAYICKEGDNFLTAAFHLTHCLVEEFNCTVRLLLYTVSIVQLVKYTQHSTVHCTAGSQSVHSLEDDYYHRI